ncbi:hypothetical protein LQU92_01805 [Kocuria sp. LUK]|uniref:Acetone carboxylase n=1 Tax=Kocuria flava TaxID=446860 RepID=A0A2N4T3T0_9MICC|nr:MULTISPECIES: hypothetical protein [Kocuria]MCD1143976.1 hypothetical protein [Kocuria sp. LUK]MCJ8506205.1 hypothetical protein [Kocuria flava]PLC12884.1 hypothetical protein AUQ48_12410 [Kocuria flava]
MEFDLLGSLTPRDRENTPAGPDAPQCSRKGCREAAAWRIRWNNPRVHTPERRKTWLACPDHREHLEQFLRARGFWKDTVPMTGPDAAGGAPAEGA